MFIVDHLASDIVEPRLSMFAINHAYSSENLYVPKVNAHKQYIVLGLRTINDNK